MTGLFGHLIDKSIQALLICRRQGIRVDLDAVREWCAVEGGLDAFEELLETLGELLDGE